MYDPTSCFMNNALVDQLTQRQVNSQGVNSESQQLALTHQSVLDKINNNEKYGEPGMMGDEEADKIMGEVPGVFAINTYERKQLKMKKHKRVKRKKYLRNKLKQTGKI